MSSLKKYFSPSVYGRYALRLLNIKVLHFLDLALSPGHENRLEQPPIFIIGPPRSGSTLLFQVLTDAFNFAYLSNRHCQFFGAPALAEQYFVTVNKKKPSDYTSLHGKTTSPTEPSECGDWWYRFFRRNPAYVTLQDIDEKRMYNFRKSLHAFTKVAGKPVLFKNLYASLRLEPLSKYVPEALYIVVRRNEFYNAASILAGRKKTLGTYENWWSVPPPGVEELKKKSPCKQVVGQIRAIYSEIDRVVACKYIKKDRVLWLEYEDYCRNTYSMIEKVDKFFRSNGLKIDRRFEVPRSFKISDKLQISESLVKELQELCRKPV